MNLILALVLTILIEFFIYCLILRREFLMLFVYSALINSVTNPLLNLGAMFGFSLILLEILVFVSEIFLIKPLMKISFKKAAAISLIANLASLLIGLALWGIL